ncbi:MAG: hybrid sensor histidine kinase/response regulator [Nitrospirales bacterium]|nr:hybrid sensor histidine kinase/response regulator [Nitrospirales bacterium]
MPDFDRQGLINIFATEAADGLLKVASALDPRDGSVPTQQSMSECFIVAHGLTGSAGLYGFEGCASLAKILARILEQAGTIPEEEWHKKVPILRDIVTTLRNQIDHINQESREDPTIFDDLKARYRQLMEGTAAPVPEATAPEPEYSTATQPDSYFIPPMEADVLEFFVPEAQEYLEAITSCLLGLEKNPEDKDTIHKLFRAAHTLKGSAFTVGIQVIGDMTHYMEDIMGAIRDGRMRVTPELTDLFFHAVDEVRLLLGREQDKLAEMRREFDPIMRRLLQASSGKTEKAPAATAVQSAATAPPREETRPAVPAEARAETPIAAKEERAPVGGMKEAVGTVRVSRDRLERLLNLVGELVIGRGRLEQRIVMLEQLSRQVLTYKGRMLDTVRTFEEKHAFTLPSQSLPAPGQSPIELPTDFGSLEFDKYDDFNILARRMTEVSADVGEVMAQLNASIRKAREDMGLLQQLTTDLRDEIARTRMVPIGALFTRFQKAVREMARTVGKPVEVVFSGANTEVDAGIVQRLADPLIHIMRNAVAHGIEPAAARAAAGKSETGTVYLNAFNRGNTVVIEIEDDGAGLNAEKIKAKAVALGLVRPERATSMSPAETINLIYLPGFSTVEAVGDQAGRGVGMDVVKRGIADMNGQIEIETEPGIGTKFTLSLPLTLLISTALMVRVGDQQYALPLPSIREILVPPAGAIDNISGTPVLQLGAGEAIEVKSLARLLGAEPLTHDGPTPIVVIRTAKGVLGLEVDGLLGLHEIVIKTLGSLKLFQGSCYSGATINPEGRVILVIDPANLLGAPERMQSVSGTAVLQDVLRLEMGDETADAVKAEDAGVLLVDDSLSVRKFIGRMLESAGYKVQTASDGEEGLRKASASSFRLIITDLEMPKMNGYELLQALRDRPDTKATPIIVMTTRAGDKHRQMAQELGASSYITKPVEERALIREVSQFVSSPASTKT